MLKNFLYFLKRNLLLYIRKQNFVIFQETKTPKNLLIFSQTKAVISPNENHEKSLYFRKHNFLIFRKRYIQNPDIFRTASTFRTLVFQDPIHIQSTVKYLRWNLLALILRNFLYFRKQNFLLIDLALKVLKHYCFNK